MPWDSNIETTKFVGKLPVQSFNNLMGAIRERCAATGTSVPSSLNADLAKLELLPSTWFSDFQSTMTTLIPLYVDHTDHSGNWDGETTIPAWTATDILALCDTTTRISAPSSIKCAAWCYQQYQMLNLMRWTLNVLIPTLKYYRLGNGTNADFTTAVADARSAYNAASWISSSYAALTENHGGYTTDFSDRYQVQLIAYVCKYYYDVPNHGFGDIPGQVYIKFERFEQYNPPGFYGTFYSEEGFTESYNLISDENVSQGLRYTTDELGDRDISPPDPDNNGVGCHSSKGYMTSISAYMIILKFTGEGGFTFKDW